MAVAGGAGDGVDRGEAQPPPPITATQQAARDEAARLARGTPEVDVLAHSVPLEQIIFDTFQRSNRQLPLPLASAAQIRALRDAIAPLHYPDYEPARDATWLLPQEFVVGYAVGDEAWAFPVRMLNAHEIVNDSLAGRPVLISFCPLCFSAVVFDRTVDGQELVFGNTSALFQSDMVMLDYQSGSYWWQVAGEALVGSLTGARMDALASLTTTWQEWRAAYPDTIVLSRATGHRIEYSARSSRGYESYLNDGNFVFPIDPALQDTRLAPAQRVVTVGTAETRAFTVPTDARSAQNATVDGVAVVVFTEPMGPSGATFDRALGAATMTFVVRDGTYVDETTGTEWTFSGRGVAGPLAGEQLRLVPSTTAFWFAAASVDPGIAIHHR